MSAVPSWRLSGHLIGSTVWLIVMAEASGKRLLLFGSGLMAKPILEYLTSKGHHVIIASNILSDAQSLSALYPHTSAVLVDVAADLDAATTQAAQADLVISMVPPPFHKYVLQACIRARKSIVTASYVNPDMKALEAELVSAGLFCMNEIGLDPGIDHMTAMKAIADLKGKGARITHFLSSCGCVPAAAACDNPLKYKYSWAPLGATGSVMRPAKYLEEGKVVEVEGVDLLKHAKRYPTPNDPPLEFYPNGNSLEYREKYGLEETQCIKRATLRYEGYAAIMRGIVALGLIDLTERKFPEGQTWRDLISELAGPGDDEVAVKLQRKLSALSASDIEATIQYLTWVEALTDLPVGQEKSLLHATASLFQRKLVYLPGQSDLTVLEHVLTYELQGETRVLTSTLRMEGVVSECSSVSKLVGYPVAIAADWLLSHAPPALGLILPVFPEFYNPVLKELERFGVTMTETDTLA